MAKHTPKELALKEVNKRIVTKEMAKERFINWIDDTTAKFGSANRKEVKDFWIETRKETLNL